MHFRAGQNFIDKIRREKTEIVKNCNKEDYNSRLEAIKENYYKALEYKNKNDRLYESYFME